MNDQGLSAEEYERLFAMNDRDYRENLPNWICHVPRIDMPPASVPELLEELKSSTAVNRRLEQLLKSSGVPIPDDIPYEEAKEKIAVISERMNDVVDSTEYQKLCTDLEKYTAALMASDEYQEELLKAEQQWEQENEAENQRALERILRHMPVNIRAMSEAALEKECKLPKEIARKFKRADVLQLLRKHPDDICRMHPSMLDGLKTAGLTLTERRALYQHLKPLGPKWEKSKDQMTERKLLWFNVLKQKFKEMQGAWKRHVEECGKPSSSHSCKLIGNQCPFKADDIDYSGDYGFPSSPQYEETDVIVAPKVKVEPKTPTISKRPPIASLLSEIATKMPPISPSVTRTSKGNRDLLSEIAEQTSKKSAPTTVPVPPSPRKKSLLKEIEKEVVDKKATKKAFEKKAADLPGLIESHYDGRKQDIKAATRSCDMLNAAMDHIEALLDGWIDKVIASDIDDPDGQIESFNEGVKDLEPVSIEILERTKWVDRSAPECELAEDLYKSSVIFFNFIKSRIKSLGKKDKALKKIMKEIYEALTLVHHKNFKSLGKLGLEPEETRRIRTVPEIMQKKMKKKGKKPKKPNSKVEIPKDEPEPVREEVAEPIEFKLEGKENLKWQLVRQLIDVTKYQRKLEKVVTNSGLVLPDEKISYQDAERKIADISKKMSEIGFKHPEYFTLEQEMQKYTSALMASDEYRAEMERRQKQWEKTILPDNQKALLQLRRHMPINVRVLSEAELAAMSTPNGKKLPQEMVKKFKRSNVLQLIRMNPSDVEKLHFANLEAMSLSNLTLTEVRAVYEHIRLVGPKWERGKADKQIERKYMWFVLVKNKLKQTLEKWEKHVKEAGPPENHRCTQSIHMCPVKAEAAISYEGDYGFTEEAAYEAIEVTKEKTQAEAMQLMEERSPQKSARNTSLLLKNLTARPKVL